MTGGAYGAETSPGGGTCAARPGVAAAAGDSFVGTASCSSGVASAAVVRAGAGAAGAAAGATRRRICTTSCGSRRLVSASKAAWTTLTGFALPKDLDRMSLMPAASTTARTAPPAITPVPGAAGLSRTFAAPNFCTISCGIVVPAIGTRIRFFRARSAPLRIESGTSLALPRPTPTWPEPSPTTTTALNEKRRPPLTTLATRLTWTTFSSRVRPVGPTCSILGIYRASGAGCRVPGVGACSNRTEPIPETRHLTPRAKRALELQARFAGRISQRLDAAVVHVAAAIEDDDADALLFGARGDGLTDSSRLVCLAARPAVACGRLIGAGRGERRARRIVDDLRIDVLQAAEDAQPWPLATAAELHADAAVTAMASAASIERLEH